MSDEEVVLYRGTPVKVNGVPNGGAINGKTGRVHGLRAQDNRVAVLLDDVNECPIFFQPQYLMPNFQTLPIRSEASVPQSSKISQDTAAFGAYGRLPRATSLPPFHSKDVKFSDENTEKVFMKLFSGDFTAEWWQNGSDALVLWARNDCEADAFRGRLIGFHLGTKLGDTVNTNMFTGNKTFHASLRESQRDALLYRVIHRFLRANGSSLAQRIVEKVWSYLYQIYARKKWWSEQLDASMIRADIAFTNNYDNIEMEKALVFVGKSLECQGRFKKVAEVYYQVASDYTPLSTKVRAYYDSGIAYMTANELEEAERAYVLALHSDVASDGEWELESLQTCNLFTALWNVYTKMLEALNRAKAAETSIVMQLLGGLLYAHGCDACAYSGLDATIQENGPRFVKALKKEFRRKVGAKRALVRMAGNSDVASFRASILSCKIPSYIMAVPKFTSEDTSDETQERRQERHAARKRVQEITTHKTHTACANCMKVAADDSGIFKSCQCQAVSYCCKECQVADWKEHKKFCTWLKEKKKNKAGA